LGQPVDGELDLDKAIRLRPNSAESYLERGFAHEHQRGADEQAAALADYTRAFELRPGWLDPLMGPIPLNTVPRAHPPFLLALSLALRLPVGPEAVDLHRRRARVLQKLGEWQRAADDATAVLETMPADAEMLILRGTAFSELGKTVESLTDLNRAIKINPGDW